MKKVEIDTRANWAVKEDDVKFNFLSKIVGQEFNLEHCDFYDYISENPQFKYSAHFKRYYDTFKCIEKAIGVPKKKKILEVGGASPISVYLSKNNEIFVTESDLRYEIDCPDNEIDILFAFEVVEHIKDQDHETFDDVVLFQGDGFDQFAKECSRVLKSGGIMVLTTPNPNSYHAISQGLDYKDTYIFRSHVREYTRDEILKVYGGLKETYYDTRFNFFMVGPIRDKWKNIFKANDWDTNYRGDDHFMILEKT